MTNPSPKLTLRTRHKRSKTSEEGTTIINQDVSLSVDSFTSRSDSGNVFLSSALCCAATLTSAASTLDQLIADSPYKPTTSSEHQIALRIALGNIFRTAATFI